MLAKILEFVKKYQAELVLCIGVFLISLLSFSIGYIIAKNAGEEPIKFEQAQNIDNAQ